MALTNSSSQNQSTQDEEMKMEEPRLEKKQSRNKKSKKGGQADKEMKDSNPESAAAAQSSSSSTPQRTVIDTNVAGKSDGKMATFLGINCERDDHFFEKLDRLFQTGFKQADEDEDWLNEFKRMLKTKRPEGPWKFPNSYHVTTLFIGGNKKKQNHAILQNHKEGHSVSVQVRALIYVPDKLVAGIVFPQTEIENEFPHVTLMVSPGWAPVTSNAIIKATCGKNGVFEQAYLAAHDGKLPAKNAGVHVADNVNIEKKGNKNEVVFILLREPITFAGYLKAYH